VFQDTPQAITGAVLNGGGVGKTQHRRTPIKRFNRKVRREALCYLEFHFLANFAVRGIGRYAVTDDRDLLARNEPDARSKCCKLFFMTPEICESTRTNTAVHVPMGTYEDLNT
jgi:hypothetical protein